VKTARSLQVLAELAARARLVRAFDAAAFAGGHAPQLGFIRDRSQWQHVMCARQSGKTFADDFILGENAVLHPESVGLFLGLKGTGVKVSNWVPIWKAGICAPREVPDDWHNETLMMTTWPNGSRVMFGGTDDLSNVKKFLGNSLRNHGIVIVDEAQDQPSEVLKYIITQLLVPMLGPTSRIILSGVLPDVPAGYFYELAADRELADAPELRVSKGFSHHEWGRAANVHTPEAMEHLHKYLSDRGLTLDDPQIQRDWFMKRVWDQDATAYRYARARNGYLPEVPGWIDGPMFGKGHVMAAVPHAHVDQFTVGIDPGGGDRTSVVVWGWGDHTHEVQHVFEWVTDRDVPVSLGEIGEVLGLVQRHYPTSLFTWDPGSGKMELDTFGADYDVPLVRAATKADLPGQVRRNNDLLSKGWAQVMIGSRLEEDYLKARWDKDARAAGAWRWASAWHPDPSEAARYALQGYFANYSPAVPEQTHAEKRRALTELAQKRAKAKRAGKRLAEDEEAQVFEGDDPWS
jgi:hypothetical protein